MKKIGIAFLTLSLVVFTACKDDKKEAEAKPDAIEKSEEALEAEKEKAREEAEKAAKANSININVKIGCQKR